MDPRESLFDQIIDYEAGELAPNDIIDLFQKLIDSGLIWQLQGHYGRMAERLIARGLICKEENNEKTD